MGPAPVGTGPVSLAPERQPASATQNSPNASTYVWTSSSVCCTEIVHCSSSPGVMKMPRLTMNG